MNTEQTKESASHHVRQVMSMPGWEILVRAWNFERERVIANGKKSRSEEKKIHMWAELDGFDKAVLMAEKIAKVEEIIQQAEEED